MDTQTMHAMPVTTTFDIPGWEVQRSLGTCFGLIVSRKSRAFTRTTVPRVPATRPLAEQPAATIIETTTTKSRPSSEDSCRMESVIGSRREKR